MVVDLDEHDLPIPLGGLLADRYLIGPPIGLGGMGLVVAAEDKKLRQKVAVKFLSRAIRGDAKAVARFEREALATAQIRSEHVVRVTDVSGPYSETPYLVMELLVGQDLASLLTKRGRLPAEEAVGYVLQACEAIAEAHAAGIIHRDLKPSNLFLTHRRDGSPLVKVVDFGISKVSLSEAGAQEAPIPGTPLTLTAAVMGSPKYMSPEQLRSTKNVDARADIWSLGVILHELVTGEPPYQGESLIGQIAMIAADPPTPIRKLRPELPPALETAILGCLAKDPTDRPADVATLARKLAPLAPRWASFSVERITGTPSGAVSQPATPSSVEPRPNVGPSASGPRPEPPPPKSPPPRTLVLDEGQKAKERTKEYTDAGADDGAHAPALAATDSSAKDEITSPSRRALGSVGVAALLIVVVLVYLGTRPSPREQVPAETPRAESPSGPQATVKDPPRSPTPVESPASPSLPLVPPSTTESASADKPPLGASQPPPVRPAPAAGTSGRQQHGPRPSKNNADLPTIKKVRGDNLHPPPPPPPQPSTEKSVWDERH